MKTVTFEDLAAKSGLMHAHDLEAVEAIYPGFIADAIERARARFAGRVVPAGEADVVRGHLSAIATREIWAKRGLVNPDMESAVREAADAAEAWLASAKSTHARPSARPSPPEGEGEAK